VQNAGTLNSIEAQLQQTMQQYVFSPNDPATWAAVCAAMSTVLTQLWQQGVLMGPTAADAFTVDCQALSAQQILNGYLNVQVGVAIRAPGQFVTFTLTQQMAASG
jgi:phage tail sheath protein FI